MMNQEQINSMRNFYSRSMKRFENKFTFADSQNKKFFLNHFYYIELNSIDEKGLGKPNTSLYKRNGESDILLAYVDNDVTPESVKGVQDAYLRPISDTEDMIFCFIEFLFYKNFIVPDPD